jgi:hypothetical protein
VRAKSEPVLAIGFVGCTFAGTGLGIVEFELNTPNLEAVANYQPERCMSHLVSEGAKDFVASIRSIVFSQFFDYVLLRIAEKRPEVIFGEAIISVDDLGLFEHSIAMLANEKIRDVILEGYFWRSRHIPEIG